MRVSGTVKYKAGNTICRILSMDAHKLVQEKKKLSMIFLLLHCTTLKGMIPADYLGVDSPAHQEKKSREKKRRKVERNTKLSRSLDSLKELHGKQSSGMLKERSKIKICSKKNDAKHFAFLALNMMKPPAENINCVKQQNSM